MIALDRTFDPYVMILVSVLILSVINTALLLYIVLEKHHESIIKIYMVSVGRPGCVEKIIPSSIKEWDCIAVLTWKATLGKYMPIVPKRLKTSDGALLELVWLSNMPPTSLPVGSTFTSIAALRVVQGKTTPGAQLLLPDLITIPEACIPQGVVVYVRE